MADRPGDLAGFHGVLLWDDGDHSYEYVVEMLSELFGYSRDEAWDVAEEVHTKGVATCWLTRDKLNADEHVERMTAYGIDPRVPWCKGSMRASVSQEDVTLPRTARDHIAEPVNPYQSS